MRGTGNSKLSMLLIVLVALSVFKVYALLLSENYVTPSQIIECSVDRLRNHTCLTLQEYARQPDMYFTNNTIFYFEPGSHTLNSSLKLESLHNFTFLGMPDHQLVRFLFGKSVKIIWEKCRNIQVSSITFGLLGNFTYSIVFYRTQIVLLQNILVISSNGVSGCSSIMCQQSVIGISNCTFFGIQGSFGAAMMISRSYAIFTGNNIFIFNRASYHGGSLYLFESALILSGNNMFKYNKASTNIMNCNYTWKGTYFIQGSGGAIYCRSCALIINHGLSFIKNSAQNSGGAIAAVDGLIVIQGSIFKSNNAYFGGAMAVYNVTTFLYGQVSFIKNRATISGGALMMYHFNVVGKKLLSNVEFDAITATVKYSRVASSVHGSSNSSFVGNITFFGNEATRGGAIRSIENNAIVVENVYLNFINNRAFHGGAIFMADTTKLILTPALNISFILNRAYGKGGAMYVEDSQCSLGSTIPIECFLSISNYATGNISLFFLNNFARVIGSTLYGGQLNKCRLYYGTNYSRDICGNNDYSDDALRFFMNISKIDIQYDESESATNISSEAERIAICHNEKMLDRLEIKLHPGEEFNITVIALGQNGSPVPTTVYSQTKYSENKYRLRPFSQRINGSCTNITLQLLSGKGNISYSMFKLYPENPCQSLVAGLTLQIDILPCPIGFELIDRKCMCDNKLQNLTKRCTICNFTKIFERTRNNFWISQTNANTLVIHEYRCPLDYCKDTSKPVNVSLGDLSSSSVQCDFNRTGILCGQCRENFSLALSSLHCIPCSNNHSALILFFALAGVVLIAVIFLFRLTVSVGTLNGLLFYANIIQANHQAYFPRLRETTKLKFFIIFISWLNLDLGIETCFYDAMDIYAYSWFQFLFPFYLLFLVGCIILACRYSRSIAKKFGQNPVAVLATLLLMSYSKILQASIVPLSWTHLVYYTRTPSNEARSAVWLYDASIQFFREFKHTALGLFAISSLVVFVLPYISLLLFGHWLKRYSNWWILSWLNKLKPFMDAYHAPYKKHTRYSTGLLLLLRLGLFLTFAVNANGSETVNLVAVSSVTITLLAIQRRVYEYWWKDLLELSFIVNLGIFSVATFYLKEKLSNDTESHTQFIVSSISIGIAFITFIGIIIYHVCLVFKSTSRVRKVLLLPFIQKSYRVFKATSAEGEKMAEGEESTELRMLPTFTKVGVDLREPLLEPESTDSELHAATY